MPRFALFALLALGIIGVPRTTAQPALWGDGEHAGGERASGLKPDRAAPGSARILSLDDPAYRWIARLHRRGRLLALNPTALPYTEGELARALATVADSALSPLEARWVGRLRARLQPALRATEDAGVFALEAAGGGVATNNERLDPVRFTDAADPTIEAGGLNLYPRASARASLGVGPVVAQLGLGFDLFYRDDPDGIPLVKELAIRNEETSLGFASPSFDVRLGNLGRQWGVPGGDGVFVSDNPRSYDGISFRMGGGALALRSSLSELDSALPDGTFTGRAGATPNQNETSIRRYLVAHRIDWRPRPWVTVTFVETMLYSGLGSSISLPAALPSALYVFLNDGPPKNNENNNIIGGILTVQRGRVFVSGQFAMDDLDLIDRNEPGSLALTGDLTVAGERADLGVALTAVSGRAYDTGLPEQSFLFGNRGIATQFSDYVHARAFADVYLDALAPGLTVRPEVQLLVQGERDIRQPYPDDVNAGEDKLPFIFAGTPERTLRAGATVRLQPSPWWWVQADLGINRTLDDGFQAGADVTRVVGFVSGGARLRLGTPVRLSW